MDRDWRVFRASLVAQEHEEKHARDRPSHANYNNNNNGSDGDEVDERQAKQEKFGSIFAAIFKSSHDADHDSSSHGHGTSHNNSNNHHEGNIFDGHSVGGAHNMIPESCKDPFVTRAEIPVLLEPKTKIDRHRWAHELEHIEAGCVLIANEKLGGVFHQTVVLVIEHNDVTGSTGIVINR